MSSEGKNAVFVLTGDPLRGGESLRAFQNVRFRVRKVAISHAIFESAVGDRKAARPRKCRNKREKPEVGGLRFRVFTRRLSLVRKINELKFELAHARPGSKQPGPENLKFTGIFQSQGLRLLGSSQPPRSLAKANAAEWEEKIGANDLRSRLCSLEHDPSRPWAMARQLLQAAFFDTA